MENIEHNLSKFFARNKSARVKSSVRIAADITVCYKCADIANCPVGKLASVGKICNNILVCFKNKCTRQDSKSFLPCYIGFGIHYAVALTCKRLHINRNRNIVSVPGVLRDIGKFRNIRHYLRTERTIDNSRHLRTGKIALRFYFPIAHACQKSVIYS